MADLFRSAFSYIQQAAPILQGNGLGTSHPLVGTTVDVGGIKVKLRSLIAEGGFGLVFSAEDSQGNLYALKRLLACDKEAADAAIREIKFQKELSGPSSIVRFVSAATRNPEQTTHGRAEFLLLTELCSGGPLIDFMQKGPIAPENIFKIFHSASSAVKHMHDRNNPITHRDIKIENLLFTSEGFIKLCDFGSSTTEIWRPDDDWNALKRSLLEEEMQKHTTPMYRAPEILDTYQNFPIGPSQDIWALGCILFYLCYRTHPFEDSAKLRIINAKYTLPEDKTPYSGFHPIIRSLLQPNPHLRPSVQELCDQLEQLAYQLKIDLAKPITGLEVERQPSPSQTPASATVTPPRTRRAGNEESNQASSQTAGAGAGEMFAQLKGQGMNMFKNFRDKSAAVVQTVQTTYGSKGPDVTWITSRVIIAPFNDNVPETIAQLSEEQMKNYIIDSSGKKPFVVFNLSERQLRCDYNRCASEMPLPPISSGVAPSLDFMIGLCKNAITFLRRDPRNMIYFTGSEAQCVLAVACLLVFCQYCDQAKYVVDAIREFRKNSTTFYFPASYLRIVDVLSTIVSCGNPDELRVMCHNAPVKVNCIYMEPVPLFNNAKTGCRPFAEIYCGGKKLWSNFKSYEELKTYESREKSISLDLSGWPVSEDVQILVYHARWSRIQNRLQKVLIFGCGFHSNFIDSHTDNLTFSRDEVDTTTSETENGLPSNFKALISLDVDPDDRGFRPQSMPEFLTYRREQIKKEWLIGCEEDELRLRQTISLVSSRPSTKAPPRPPPPGIPDGRSVPLVAPGYQQPQQQQKQTSNLNLDNPFESTGTAPKQQQGFADFFATLEWSSSSGQPQQPAAAAATSSHTPPPPRPSPPQQDRNKVDDAREWEKHAGIRVHDEDEDEDAHLYKFDYEKKSNNIPDRPPLPQTPADDTEKLIDDLDELLDFAGNASSPPIVPQHQQQPPMQQQQPQKQQSHNFFDDIFSSSSNAPMHRNVSAPSFPNNGTTTKNGKPDDPFADLFKPSPKSEQVSGRSTPQRPNPAAGLPPMDYRQQPAKPPAASNANKGSGDVFADLLADHGISDKKKATMGQMLRTEEEKFMDPVSIKIRNWTQNKNGNVRALLSSLDEVLWPEAGNWAVPSLTDMLNDNVVKKVYFKACLLVHPDKQVGKPHHALAQEIFTVLNTAMIAFEENKK